MSTTIIKKPTSFVYDLMQSQQRITVWLIHDTHLRFDGVLIGYDEFMSLVLDEAYEHNTKTKTSVKVGRLVLRGDSVGLMYLSN